MAGDKKRGESVSRDDGAGFDGSSRSKVSASTKKSAKERKRELEAMYGSAALKTPPNDRLSESKKSKKKKKSSKSKQSRLDDSDDSIGIEDLHEPQHKEHHTRTPPPPQPPPPLSPSKKTKRHQSISNEQSMDLDQIMMQQSIMGRTHLQRGQSQRSGTGAGAGRASMTRQASPQRPTMQRGRSQDRSMMNRSGLHQSGIPSNMRSTSMDPSTKRGLARGQSSRRGRSLDRSTSTTMNASSLGASTLGRSASIRRGARPPASLGAHFDRQASMARSKSMMNRSGHHSFDASGSFVSDVVSINGMKGRIVMQPVSPGDSERLRGGAAGKRGYIRRFIPYKEPEKRPPRSLVLIWAIVAAELGFDLATTIIAFQSFIEQDTCCGGPITLGVIPIGSTIPFFMLVVAELAFLIRAIVLTMWPSMMTGDESTELTMEELEMGVGKQREQGARCRRYLCCFLRWKVHILLQFLNFLVLLNPFFGCIIAWILMYQSDKTEAFIVLGMEGAALILHYVSVWLEGSLKTLGGFLFNSIPVIPFAVSIGLVLWYLKQGGVCYLADENLFKFTGCEICNITGVLQPCPNSTNLFTGITEIASLEEARDKVLERNNQGTYCSAEKNFCFFDYDTGQLPPVNANETAAPSGFIFDVTNIPTDPPASPVVVPPSLPQEPDEDPQQPEPTIPPVNPTDAPTPIPTDAPVPDPTPAPTDDVPEPQPEPEPQPTPGSEGSDGFNPDDTGSDGFNMNDLFGRRLYV